MIGQDVKAALSSRLREMANLEARIRIAELEDALIERDGGSHDADCKSYRNKGCNCGHDRARRVLGGRL